MNKGYSGLVIGSGGMKGLGCLGALTVLHYRGYLNNIKNYAGTSVGSIICTLMAIGWKPIEIFMKASRIAIFTGISSLDINNFKEHYGMMSNDLLKDELEKLILQKRPTIPTLLDLHKEGIYIAYSICDRISRTGHKLDYKSHPTLKISDAGLMSSNIPFIFSPIDFDGMKVIDGALTNPFPINYIDNGRDKILAISLFGRSSDGEDSFFSFASDIIMIEIEEMQRSIAKHASSHVDILEMTVEEMSVMSSQQDYKCKLEMFFDGLHDGKVIIRALKRRAHKLKKGHRNIKVKSSGRRNVEHSVKSSKYSEPETEIQLPSIPDEVIVKCLMSQSVDVLCQAVVTKDGKESLFKNMKSLGVNRIRRIENLCQSLIKSSERSGEKVEPEIRNVDEYVKVKRNYTQEVYETLPDGLKNVASSLMNSMSKEESDTTINGINIIFEGLNRLGLNLLSNEPFYSTYPVRGDRTSRKYRDTGQVEILDDEDFIDMEDINIELGEMSQEIKRDIDNID